jgi:signal transduction histidine kinase
MLLVVGTGVVLVAAQLTKPGSGADLILLAPAVGALVVRGLGAQVRAELLAVVVVVPVAVVVARTGSMEIALFFPVLVTVYTSWHLRSLIRASAILLATAGSPLLVTLYRPESDIEWMAWSAANVFTFVLGTTLRQHQEVIEQLRAAREELALQAVSEERRRIARELHDLAGHTLAAMLLHVTGARHVLQRDPAEAGRALDDAEAVGRSSLDQIRAVVATLRTDERGTDAALASSDDLEDLVDAYRRAGLAIEATLPDRDHRLEGPTGSALHRIAQESLANVARHAPGNRVTLALSLEPDPAAPETVTLSVTDQGRRPAPRPAGVAGAGAHFGLIGMRERARALGGDLDAGPHDDGWRVVATVPVDRSVPSDGSPGPHDRPVPSDGGPQPHDRPGRLR